MPRRTALKPAVARRAGSRPPRARQERGVRTEEAILQATLRLLATRGIHGMSLDLLADEVGIAERELADMQERLRAALHQKSRLAALGVGVRGYRLAAFLVAAVYGAVGGVLLAVPTGLADPLLAYWTHSGNLVFMLLLGGFANFFGPILGAFVFIFLQDQVMSVTAYWRLVFGTILAVVVIFFPRGLTSLGGGLDGPLRNLPLRMRRPSRRSNLP